MHRVSATALWLLLMCLPVVAEAWRATYVP